MSAPAMDKGAALLAQLLAADAAVATVQDNRLLAEAAGGLQPTALGQALIEALQALAVLGQADAEVMAVADILRRDQKFSPPGRPSLHLVLLRRQQASVQQAQRAARQAWAAAAAAFVRQAGWPLKPGIAATDSLLRWLAKR